VRNLILGVAGVLAAGLLAAACSSGGGTAAPSPSATHSATQAATPSASSPAAQAGFPVMVEGKVADLALRSVPGIPGQILVDGKGRPLYMFDKDVYGKPSACKGPCASVWQPEFTDFPKLGPGVDDGLIAVFTRKDGRVQTMYNGWMLYYFTGGGDTDTGPANGQGKSAFGGHWYVLDKDGNPVKSS